MTLFVCRKECDNTLNREDVVKMQYIRVKCGWILIERDRESARECSNSAPCSLDCAPQTLYSHSGNEHHKCCKYTVQFQDMVTRSRRTHEHT